MQLNERIIEKAEIVKEGLSKGILARVWYPIMRFGVRNANKRVYERAVGDTILGDENIKTKLQTRTLFGNQEHPVESQVKLNWQETSHIVSEFKVDENKNILYAAMDILAASEPGKFIYGLLEAGCLVGVSTRADGELEEAIDENGEKYHKVIPGAYKFQTVDFTGDPSTPNTVPEQIIRAVESNYNSHTLDKKVAIALLEYVNTEESKKLEEIIKEDRQHSNCNCTSIGDKRCNKGCQHHQENKMGIKIGEAVKVGEKIGVVAHLFPKTQKVIVQFADSKQTINVKECQVVKEDTDAEDNQLIAKTEARVRKIGTNAGISNQVLDAYIEDMKDAWEPEAYRTISNVKLLDDIKTYIAASEVKEEKTQIDPNEPEKKVKIYCPTCKKDLALDSLSIKHDKEGNDIPVCPNCKSIIELKEKITTSSDKSGQPANAKAAKEVMDKSKTQEGVDVKESKETPKKEDTPQNRETGSTKENKSVAEAVEVYLDNDKGNESYVAYKDGKYFGVFLTMSEVKKQFPDFDEKELISGLTEAIREEVQALIDISPKVKEFLVDNWPKFENDNEAVKNLIQVFKLTEEKAKEYVAEMVKKNNTEMDVRYKTVKEARTKNNIPEYILDIMWDELSNGRTFKEIVDIILDWSKGREWFKNKYQGNEFDLRQDLESIYEEEENKTNETIVQKGSEWQVQSHKGRNLGTYKTKEEAEKRLKQVEMFKHMKESKIADKKVGDFIAWKSHEGIKGNGTGKIIDIYQSKDGKWYATAKNSYVTVVLGDEDLRESKVNETIKNFNKLIDDFVKEDILPFVRNKEISGELIWEFVTDGDLLNYIQDEIYKQLTSKGIRIKESKLNEIKPGSGVVGSIRINILDSDDKEYYNEDLLFQEFLKSGRIALEGNEVWANENDRKARNLFGKVEENKLLKSYCNEVIKLSNEINELKKQKVNKITEKILFLVTGRLEKDPDYEMTVYVFANNKDEAIEKAKNALYEYPESKEKVKIGNGKISHVFIADYDELDEQEKMMFTGDGAVAAFEPEMISEAVKKLKEQNSKLFEFKPEHVIIRWNNKETADELIIALNKANLKWNFIGPDFDVEVNTPKDISKVNKILSSTGAHIIDIYENKIKELKEAHTHELIKVYVDSKVISMGLNLGKSSLALLENCKSKEEVDAEIRKIQDSIRDTLTQSVNLNEIQIESEITKNPEQNKIDTRIGKVLESFTGQKLT